MGETASVNSTVHDCRRIAPALAQLGDKWTVLIIMILREGPRRFNDIKRQVGSISQQMLTRTLKNLERDGMVVRTAFPTSPPQVRYELSRLGHALAIPVYALGVWVNDRLDEIDHARAAYEERQKL